MKKLIALLLLFIGTQNLFAQTTGVNHDYYKTEDLSFGGGLISRGWNIWMERGYIKDGLHRKFWQIEYLQERQSREVKQNIDLGFSLRVPPKPFIFGKRNSFYVFNGYLGQQLLLGNKAEKSGVEISLKYAGGVSLGVIKPYYLNLIYAYDSNGNFIFKTEKYTEENKDKFSDWNSIYGGAGFAKGLTEIGFIPGLTAKASLNFNWATYDDYIKAIEVGAMVQIYYKKVPLMINVKNPRIFANLYVNLQLGKRW